MIVGAGAFVLCARAGLLTPSEAELRARYGLPGSKFMDVDGEPIHYVDEGQGDAVVLVHGSFGSLRMWDGWARTLAPRYRVIRFDRPPMGLSGPDPNGDYDPEREVRIIGALTEKLGIAHFFLVATSSAGFSGAAYAAAHPEQIRGLILSNIAVGPLTLDRDHLPFVLKLVRAIDPLFKGWHPRELWRQVLRNNFADPSRVTPDLVREWTDLNNRAQRMPRAPGARNPGSLFARTPEDLRHITAPTLLLWSENDPEVPVDPVGKRGLGLLAAADKHLEIVPHCGHMMPIECSEPSVALAEAFLDRIESGAHP